MQLFSKQLSPAHLKTSRLQRSLSRSDAASLRRDEWRNWTRQTYHPFFPTSAEISLPAISMAGLTLQKQEQENCGLVISQEGRGFEV